MTPYETQWPVSRGFNDPWSENYGITPYINRAMADPNQTVAAQEIRRDLIRPYAPILTCDLIEGPSDYHVHVDLPGVEDLTTEVIGRDLVIKAERKIVHDTNTDTVHAVERSTGKVSRKLRIPQNADVDRVTSRFFNGVLTVSFPKKQDTEPFSKKIDIQFA